MSFITYEEKKFIIEQGKLLLSDEGIKNLSQINWHDNYHFINEIDLSFNQITDISSLEKLISLKRLNLAENQISDITPLKNLVLLENLNLSKNKIEEVNSLEKLISLKHLYLAENQISDFTSLENLGLLEKLELSKNQITDISSLVKLTSLESLSLSKNKIEDISPLKKLTLLEFLELSKSQITDISSLEELTLLEKLDLSNNQITDISPLEELTLLEDLDLSQNNIENVYSLEKLSLLERLGLSKNQITDISPLEELTLLEDLDLSQNNIENVYTLEKLSLLEKLDLSKNQITEISSLAKLTSLEKLDLSKNQITDVSFLEKLTSLYFLDLSKNQIEDINILDKLMSLRALYLSKNQIIDITPLEKLSSLNYLGISGNQIKDIKPLEGLTKIIFLDLSVNQITSIFSLEKLTSLGVLNLSANRITDITPLEKLNLLQFLNLNNIEIIDIEHLIKIIKNSKIRFLKINYQKLNLRDPRSQNLLIDLLDICNARLYHYISSIKRIFFKEVKHFFSLLLENINIIINLPNLTLAKKENYENQLKSVIQNLINFEDIDSLDYYRLKALENIILASLEKSYEEALNYIDIAISWYRKAQIPQCEYFHQFNSFLFKSQLAYREKKYDVSKKFLVEISNLHKNYDYTKFDDSIKELIAFLPEIQKNLINILNPRERIDDLLEQINNKCCILMDKAVPNIQFKFPGIYRIVKNILGEFSEDFSELAFKKRHDDPDYLYKLDRNYEELLEVVINKFLDKKIPDIESRIRKWLDQFLKTEKPYALLLLDHLRYIDIKEFDKICKDLEVLLLNEIISLSKSKQDIGGYDYFFINIGGMAKSSSHTLYNFRLATRISEDKFIDLFKSNVEIPQNSVLIYIDDVTGTGKQMKEDWGNYLESLEIKYKKDNKQEKKFQNFLATNKFIYSPLFSTQKAKERIEKNTPFIVVTLPQNIITEKFMSLHKESGIFNIIELKYVRKIFRKYGELLYPKAPLGYGDLELLICFYYNTPNNTLPIIWQKAPSEFCTSNIEWTPLFPRHESRKNHI